LARTESANAHQIVVVDEVSEEVLHGRIADDLFHVSKQLEALLILHDAERVSWVISLENGVKG
jgi:hypothetical protein